jgi:hypothetical protein
MLAKLKETLVAVLGTIGLVLLLSGSFELWDGFWGRTFVLPVMATSTSWPTTPGICYEHDINRSWSRPHNHYYAELTYKYTVDGVRYTSDDICFFQEYNCGFGKHQPEEAQALLDLYPQGSQVTVSYDPEDPSRATLQPEDVTPELRAEMSDHFRDGGLFLVAALVLVGAAMKLGLGDSAWA